MSDIPTDILASGATTYEEKNDDYGDSWRKVGEMLFELADGSIEIDSVDDAVAFGLLTRRMDKIARAVQLTFGGGDPNNESLRDSHEDEMVYAAMQASLYDADNTDSTPSRADCNYSGAHPTRTVRTANARTEAKRLAGED